MNLFDFYIFIIFKMNTNGTEFSSTSKWNFLEWITPRLFPYIGLFYL